MKTFEVDKLKVNQYNTREEMGQSAAKDVATKIKELLKTKAEIAMIFAAAPSQNEFLSSLLQDKEIDFYRINAFHMDEYIGLEKEAPQGFGNFLKDRLFNQANFKTVSYIDGQNSNPQEECNRYAKLLNKQKIDIVCMGIGENAHIAFNDPHIAFFDDKEAVKIVELDLTCRQQQVNDGCFSSIDKVPMHAITLTIPTLVSADYIYCMVPAKTKAEAVKNVVTKEISEKYPASILRRCENATMYIDADSGSLI
ncbi:glucosamine-6-phosphate deaminase [Paludicola sp. MB14-C6]|uniref:glucosamine-6-phosphate deaminase n=1 Tax=Paludihabitans sp. MB14-C6 TaxID=3070656 RepID=UPI0027DC8CB6|nr:glucosamine-6-phosphate deaminase [Paludicola sp. MB14-C6]WMJ23264.1 glucosamine-6-phosphate deaminase [Paludicola sp. MB14-C6]